MADEDLIGQDEIESLLGQSSEDEQGAAADASDAAEPGTATADATQAAPAQDAGRVGQADVELLLNQAQQAIASIDEGADDLPSGAQAFNFKDFVGTPASTESASLELMQDVELDLKIELGRTQMQLEDVLRLERGAVVTLDKLAGDPVDIYVNGRLIARGEVLVLNDNFCVRVAELIAGESAVA